MLVACRSLWPLGRNAPFRGEACAAEHLTASAGKDTDCTTAVPRAACAVQAQGRVRRRLTSAGVSKPSRGGPSLAPRRA